MNTINPDADFLDFLRQGRFMIQRARTSGKYFFYPRVAEPGTGDTDLEWVEASGLGTVHSTTVVRVKPPEPSYNVVLVDLDEGPRIMSRVEGIAPEAVKIGMKVRACVLGDAQPPCVVFEPLSTTESTRESTKESSGEKA
jgi:uncharacterized OB-fold protein